MKTRFTRRQSNIAATILLLALAILYLLTLDDGLRPAELAGGDLITHQYAQAQGRFSNAPGYPLYTLGGWLWLRIGRLLLGGDYNPIRILSSYSTLWALVALWLLYQLSLEVTRGRSQDAESGGNGPVAVLVTGAFGLTYFFWYYAVTTEQYTSAVAWTLAVVLLAFRWERSAASPHPTSAWIRWGGQRAQPAEASRPERQADMPRVVVREAVGCRDGYLLALALLTGVALAHMLTLLIIVLPLLWFVLHADAKLLRRPRLIVAVLALVALPLLSYSLVYVRGAQHPEWRGVGAWSNTWQWFWSFVSTRQGRGELTWSLRPFLTPEFPSLIWRELTWPGLIAGALGIATLGRRRAGLLYATLALYLVFCWIDRLGNWYQVIMPVYALLAVGMAAGADWVWRKSWGAGVQERRKKNGLLRASATRLPGLILVALIALAAYRGAASYPRANAHGRAEDTGLAPGWAILADDPPAATAVLGTQAEALALNYLTEIWGQRRDLRSVTSDQARNLLAQGTSLAVTEQALPLAAAEVSADAHYSALGRTLVAVSAAPAWRLAQSGAPQWQSWQHAFGEEVRLQAGRIDDSYATGETVVFLVWQAGARPPADWSVSVRLTHAGQELAQLDQAHPVYGAYPMSRWSPGEVVVDAYPFKLPPAAQPDGGTVILYRRLADGSFMNLDVAQFKWVYLK